MFKDQLSFLGSIPHHCPFTVSEISRTTRQSEPVFGSTWAHHSIVDQVRSRPRSTSTQKAESPSIFFHVPTRTGSLYDISISHTSTIFSLKVLSCSVFPYVLSFEQNIYRYLDGKIFQFSQTKSSVVECS